MYDREKYINTDPPIKKKLLSLFNRKKPIIIFDIGGCEGEESIKYSRIFPFARIFIFEPLPNNQKRIEKNLIDFNLKNIELVPIALSDTIGEAEFFVSSGFPDNHKTDLDWDFGNKSSSLLQPEKYMEVNQPWLKFNERINVNTSTITKFVEEKSLIEIDFIHMDVQGAELKVLNGAKSFLHKIKSIWLEVSEHTLYAEQPLKKDIEKFMITNGFYLVESVIENGIGDQFYLNKDYFKTMAIFNKKFHFNKRNKKRA